MKKGILLFWGLAASTIILFNSNAGGAAAAGNGDRTGAPGSSGTCNSCHSGGNFGPSTSIDVKDSGGNSVTTVMGDSLYTVVVTVTATTGSPAGYGFQAVALQDSSHTNIGLFQNAGSNVRFSTANSRQLAEQNARSASNTFTFKWKAPAYAPDNSVTIYAFGNVVNGANGDNGDRGAADTYTMTVTPTVAIPSAIQQVDLSDLVSVQVYPNPTVERLNLRLDVNCDTYYTLGVFAANGQQVRQQNVQTSAGDNLVTLDVLDLPVGAYRLVLQDEQGRKLTRSFVKF